VLLDDIQNAAIDDSSDLGTVLRKCKVLAATLDNRPLEQWLLLEANGYPPQAELPDYRLIPITLRGRFQSATHSGNALVIPPACLPKETRDELFPYRSRQSITVIQSLAAKDDSGGSVAVPYSNLPLIVQGKAYPGMNCYEAWGEVSSFSLTEIVNTVRNRVLDFVLALKKELPDMGVNSSDKEIATLPAERVTQIFLTVSGDYANVVGNAVHSPVTFNVNARDFSSLRQAFAEHGVTEEDLSDLKAALDADPEPAKEGYGPRVAAWMGRMVQKAADGSWQITISAAGQLLAEGISRYHGWK